MEMLDEIILNLRDLMNFGLLFPIRHVAATAIHSATFKAKIQGGGAMTLRARGSDINVFRQVFGKKDYDLSKFAQEKWIRAAYERILGEGKVPLILDAGANIGASAVWFALKFPRAKIIAVEPQAGNAAICRKNIKDFANITLVEAALGGAPGTVNISEDVQDWAFQTARTEAGAISIRTISELFATEKNGRPFIVKMDIEGFEKDVFSAPADWLDEVEAFIVEPHDWMMPGAGTSYGLQRALGPRQFDMLLSGENLVYVRAQPAQ